MRMDCSVWNIKTWSNFKWEFMISFQRWKICDEVSSRPLNSVSVHLWRGDCSCWTAAADVELEDSQSVRKQSQGAVQSAEFSCQSTLQTHHMKHCEVDLALRCSTHTSGALFHMTRGANTAYQLNNLGNQFADKSKLWSSQKSQTRLNNGNWRRNVKSGMKINVTMKNKMVLKYHFGRDSSFEICLCKMSHVNHNNQSLLSDFVY